MSHELPKCAVVLPLLAGLLAGCVSASSPAEHSGDAGEVTHDSGLNPPGSDGGGTPDSGTSGDSGSFCSTPLGPSSGPATLDDAPIADWCTATSGRMVGWTCGGFIARVAGIGADCDREFLFDATSRRLVAVVGGCSGTMHCEAGDPGFKPPSDCWSGNVTFPVTNVCADAAAAPADAGAACNSSAQCPTGFACVFAASEPCYGFGFCAFANFSHDPTCSPASYCACDGTMTQGCEGAYYLKPVPTRGGSAVCGD
jgi:hypothetical protein